MRTLGDVHSLLIDSPHQMVAFTGLHLSSSWGIDVEHMGMFNVWWFLCHQPNAAAASQPALQEQDTRQYLRDGPQAKH